MKICKSAELGRIDITQVSDKMKAVLTIASMVRESGKSLTAEAIKKAKEEIPDKQRKRPVNYYFTSL